MRSCPAPDERGGCGDGDERLSDGFLALLGDDTDLCLALLDEEHRIGRLAFVRR